MVWFSESANLISVSVKTISTTDDVVNQNQRYTRWSSLPVAAGFPTKAEYLS